MHPHQPPTHFQHELTVHFHARPRFPILFTHWRIHPSSTFDNSTRMHSPRHLTFASNNQSRKPNIFFDTTACSLRLSPSLFVFRLHFASTATISNALSSSVWIHCRNLKTIDDLPCSLETQTMFEILLNLVRRHGYSPIRIPRTTELGGSGDARFVNANSDSPHVARRRIWLIRSGNGFLEVRRRQSNIFRNNRMWCCANSLKSDWDANWCVQFSNVVLNVTGIGDPSLLKRRTWQKQLTGRTKLKIHTMNHERRDCFDDWTAWDIYNVCDVGSISNWHTQINQVEGMKFKDVLECAVWQICTMIWIPMVWTLFWQSRRREDHEKLSGVASKTAAMRTCETFGLRCHCFLQVLEKSPGGNGMRSTTGRTSSTSVSIWRVACNSRFSCRLIFGRLCSKWQNWQFKPFLHLPFAKQLRR